MYTTRRLSVIFHRRRADEHKVFLRFAYFSECTSNSLSPSIIISRSCIISTVHSFLQERAINAMFGLASLSRVFFFIIIIQSRVFLKLEYNSRRFYEPRARARDSHYERGIQKRATRRCRQFFLTFLWKFINIRNAWPSVHYFNYKFVPYKRRETLSCFFFPFFFRVLFFYRRVADAIFPK